MRSRIRRLWPPLLIGAVFLSSVGGLFFTGCGKKPDGPSSGAAGSGPEGTWYEQEENGGVLTVSGKKMTYTHWDYTFTTGFSTKKSGGKTEIVPDEEYWVLIDIFYDPSEDVITGHDMPHTDGDGGYHLHTFARSEYVAPPPPVYGERTDNTDPDARKTFSDYTVKTLSLKLVEPWRDPGDMAVEQPQNGYYEYELTVGEDGTGTISSDFCHPVEFGPEKQEELRALLEESAIAELNGIDVWTEEMPEDTQRYELSIEFADGETFSSRANGADVSGIWLTDGRELHKLLFFTFVDAGYNWSTGEFHSTEPMKRIGTPSESAPAWNIVKELQRIERKGTAYDYEIHSEYPVFTAEGDAPEALMKTLAALTEEFKARSERDLEEMDADMAAASKSDRKKSDRWYAYSFYSPEWIHPGDLVVRMFVSEGHANSLGLGQYGGGYYPNFRYNIDPRSGKILSAADFFNDTEALADYVIDRLCETFSYSDYVNYYRSAEHRAILIDVLTKPENEDGIGVDPGYQKLTLYFDRMERDEEGFTKYPYQLDLYYDDIQDLLNDRYTSVW